jgi:outer membrane lipoprotein SlyB
MNDTGVHKTHPLIVIAATAVILTCLVAIGVMTGILPSPLNRNAADDQQLTAGATTSSTAPTLRESSPSGSAATRESRTASRPPAHEPRRLSARTPAPATGTTASSAPSQTVAGTGAAPAVCTTCGTVSSVRAVAQQGDASMIGPAAGALLGGLAGRQIGGGSGKTIATVIGAGAGAAAGTEIERRYKTTTHYVVAVRMNDGSHRSFNYASAPALSAGDHVRVSNGSLVRD